LVSSPNHSGILCSSPAQFALYFLLPLAIRNPDFVRVSYFETVLTIDLMGARGRPDHFSIT